MQKNRLGNFPTRFIIEPKFVFKNVDFIRFLYFNSVQNLANLDFCPSLNRLLSSHHENAQRSFISQRL